MSRRVIERPRPSGFSQALLKGVRSQSASACVLLLGFILVSLVVSSCSPNGNGSFLWLSDQQLEEDPGEQQETPSPEDEEEDEDSDIPPIQFDWVPGPVVEGEVSLLDGPEPIPVVGAQVSELGVDGLPIETDEDGRFAIEVENQDPWRLYASASEDMTPAIWTTSLDAVEASGMPVLVDLLERANCEVLWRLDFGMDWAEDRGAVIVLVWKDGTTRVEPEMTGLSVSVNVPGEEQWGLDSDDRLVPVDGLLQNASEAELWLVGIPEGTHALTWSNPDGYECFAPEQVPVLGRTNTWVQMGCRRI